MVYRACIRLSKDHLGSCSDGIIKKIGVAQLRTCVYVVGNILDNCTIGSFKSMFYINYYNDLHIQVVRGHNT